MSTPSGIEARIIDASLNRACEAARVMEDVARFALDHAPLSARLKQIRHAIRGAAVGFDTGLLLAWRDTPGDVGTAVSTPTEYVRGSLASVAAAAESRLTEALRSIEENAKILAKATAAQAFESIRYEAYTAARELRLALGQGETRQWQLCVLITEALCEHHPWDRIAQLAIEGGADCLQLREKNLPDKERLRRARRLLEIAGDIPVILNDRVDLAVFAGVDGVHLGAGDVDIQDARTIAGFHLTIGLSTHSLDEARAAVQAGADYCGVGSMFPTTTRDHAIVRGPQALAEHAADPVASSRPHLAIGGITPENITQLAAVGCPGVAVSSCVCGDPDPRAVCENLVAALRAPPDA